MKQLLDEDEYLMNPMQGQYWQQRLLERGGDGLVIPLILYHDDFEPGNCLGFHAGKSSVGVLYASIPCIQPQYAARLEYIYPVLIFRAEDRKKFGNAATFEPAIKELKDLDINGIEIFSEHVYFEVILISGDNKGLNSIFGLTENFTSGHCCRTCRIDRDSMKSLVIEVPQQLRTIDNYNEDVKSCDPQSTGIHEVCCFHELPHFHICVNIYHDALHDILISVLKTTKLTLHEVNQRIKAFDFLSVNESNPLEIKSKDRLKMSADEMLCFTRYFGILFGDFIEELDAPTIQFEYWCMYKKLREILDLVLAPRLLEGHIKQLRVLVSEHNAMYTRLVGPLPPKLHFLEHYVQLIRQFGPAVSYWTMRYESKHRELKNTFNQLAGTVNTNKSIASTVQKNIFHNARSFQYCDVTDVKRLQNSSEVLSLIPAHYQIRDSLQLYSV